MILESFPIEHVHNAAASSAAPYGPEERAVLDADAFAEARAEIASWPGYAPTPLVALRGLAEALDIGAIHYKDESRRFGLGSFKALGGAYAVLRILQRHLRSAGGAEPPTARHLIAGRHAERTSSVTVTCATDGNHGRSVAWGARMFGCRCVIYLHAHVSPQREAAIARYGAEIVRVAGGYDDAVRQCAQDAERNGWFLVADTSANASADIPSLVMHGYGVLIAEALEQLSDSAMPTHVFVQAGVGGLAASIGGYLWERFGPQRPRLVVVEPKRADCVFRSIAAGLPTVVPGDADTFMACLAAAEVSPAAWVILRTAADDVVSLPDESAGDTMRILAAGVDGDPPIVAGESGCAAAAGLIAAAMDRRLRSELALDRRSRILVIGSEGATDPDTYRNVVGRPAEAVAHQVG